ncbi:MAG: hypothetical protein ACR2PF_16510 [Rhizobiaceae bacterium]
MAGVELITFAIFFGGGALFCLGWMMWNLFRVMRREQLSWDLSQRASQTGEILLKPAIAFFVLGALGAVYLMLRVEPVAP